MQALASWQSWRLRCLPIVKSIAQHPPRSPACSAPFLLLKSDRLRGKRFIASQNDLEQCDELWVAEEIKERVDELQKSGIDPYPRGGPTHTTSSLAKFDRINQTLKNGETRKNLGVNSYQGRIDSVRTAGRLLFFVDINRKDLKLQILVNHARILDSSTTEEFVARRKLLRRGDIITVAGYPHRTESGQLSLSATELPRILSPCLHQFPVQKPFGEVSAENESHFLDKHVGMLANYETTQLMLRRSEIVREMRQFLHIGGYTEVQTPVLSTGAGGAIAKSFETSATEFSEKRLSLRVAPELWLKRLVLGGMDRIFEIGPCFRNEGLDRLHNPEFTTCEFYGTYTSIQALLKITENMLNTIVKNMEHVPKDKDEPNRLPRTKMPQLALDSGFFKGPYRQIDFLLALNEALALKLPDLRAESATAQLVSILQEKKIALPVHPNLPRLLDKLSATYLEPQCDKPTWIINHPECLSPLSKTLFHPSPDVAQPVAARAELFIHGREIVNCYEEENSPFEQRRKFMMQQRHANAGDSKTLDEEVMEVDEDYLKALEWGLPPTGGWGCGIDRLVMLLTGKQRINEVLTFGNLRSVTRTSESREMVQVPALSTQPLKSKSNHHGASGATREVEMDQTDAERSSGAGTSKTRPQLDAPEEAVLKIKQRMKWENSSRSRPSKDARGSSSAEQKRLAVWLAGRGGPDAAEWLLGK